MTAKTWAEAFNLSLAQQIKMSREQQGLSKKAMAEKAGLSPNYIGYIENLERRPTVETLARIAHGLGVLPSDLVINAEISALKMFNK